MDQRNPTLYAFDTFRVDVANRLVLSESGEVLPLKARAFDTLIYLVEHAGEVIGREEMLAAIWADTVVEENNLTQHISTLRRLFGERPNDHRYIVTIPGRGYKFVPDVSVLNSSESFQPLDTAGESQQESTNTNWAGRRWLFMTAVFVVVGLSTVGFILWRENRTPALSAVIRSLAVLPFKPLVAGIRDESLELGMADTMIAKLSAGDIRVRPLAAVRRYNGIDQDPLAAGRELRVEAVLDGSIQILNDRVRISASLIRVSDGKQLWAEQYNGAAADIFALQDSISERVADALPMALAERSRKNYTASVEAYQLFSRGKFHSSKLILPEVQKGISYFEQAIAVDPGYAMAYVEIANACRALVLTNDARPNDVMPKARMAAERATELDPTLAEAQAARALTAFWYDFDPQRAEELQLRAIELDPQSAQSRFGYAHLLSNTGRHDEALAEIRRAREIDPVNLVTNALEGQILFFAGRDDEAMKVLQETSEMDPNFWLPKLFMSRIFIKKGMWDDAIATAAKARDLSRGNAEAIATIGYVQARAGRTADARNTLAELEERGKTRHVSSYGIAAIYYALGDRTKALDLLERALDERDALLVFLKIDLKWYGLREEPRFIQLMKKMKFS